MTTKYNLSLFSDEPAPKISADQKFDPALFSDQPAPESSSLSSRAKAYASDVGKNAVREVTDFAKSVPGTLQTALDIGNIPHDAIGAVIEKATGTPLGETKLASDLETLGNLAKSGPGIIVETGKDIVKSVIHPVDSFRERPLNTIGNILTLAGGAGALARKAAPVAAEAAETAANAMGRRATGFTKALIKGKNYDKANDAVQWMMEKKIMTPGASVDDMLSRASAAKDEAWANMSKSLEAQNLGAKGALKPKAAPQLREQFLFDTKNAIDDLEDLRPKAKNGKVLTGGDYTSQNDAIDHAIETVKAHGERPIPWDETNDLKKNLRANWDTTKSNEVNDLKKRIYGTFNDNMETQMEGAASARGGDISAFKAAKQDYGAAKTAEKALDNLRSSKSGNRQMGLTDTTTAIAGAAAHGSLGAAAAVLAKKLIERFGLTTGATLAQKLSVVASKAPQLLGPYAPAMQKALAAGGAELAFTHGALVKAEPDYRAFVKVLSKE